MYASKKLVLKLKLAKTKNLYKLKKKIALCFGLYYQTYNQSFLFILGDQFSKFIALRKNDFNQKLTNQKQ